MNNDNGLKHLHSMTKSSGWLRYWIRFSSDLTITLCADRVRNGSDSKTLFARKLKVVNVVTILLLGTIRRLLAIE